MAECAFELSPGLLERVKASRSAPGGRMVVEPHQTVLAATCPGSFADHGMLEATPEPPPEAKKIRDLCGRPRVEDAAGVIEYMDSVSCGWTRAQLAAAVSAGNRNQKAAIHFAAQMRSDDDCLTMCRALIERGAAVNATTLRGHTALIFAAGRGRDTAVRFLLAHGAKARVMTVTGHSAAQMGKGRLSPDTQAQLELAEATEATEWHDFRSDARALDAQAEHVHHCPSCRAKAAAAAGGAITMPCAQRTPAGQVVLASREETELFEVKQTLMGVLDDVEATVRLGDDLLAALTVSAAAQEEQALAMATDALVTVAAVAKPRKSKKGKSYRAEGLVASSGIILRLGIRRFITEQDGLLLLLRACREEALGRALSRRDMRDRRPIRTVLAALLTELRHLAGGSAHTLQPLLGLHPEGQPHTLMTSLSAAKIVEATDPHLAMEVLHLRRANAHSAAEEDDEEHRVVQELWRSVVGSGIIRAEGGYTPEVALISGRQLRKKEGGAMVMLWARCVRWAVVMATGGYSIAGDTGDSASSHWQLRRKPQMVRRCQLGRPQSTPEPAPSPEPESANDSDSCEDLPGWCVEMVREIGVAAAAKRKTDLLLEALEPVPAHVSRVWGTKPGHPSLPLEAVKILRSCGSAMLGQELGLSPQSLPAQSAAGKCAPAADLEEYALATPPVWVAAGDAEGIESVRTALQGLLDPCVADGKTLWVGVDTEWGEIADAEGLDAPPAIIQLAAKDSSDVSGSGSGKGVIRSWVIDANAPSVTLCALISWLFGSAGVTVLGFAFSHDIYRLAPLTCNKRVEHGNDAHSKAVEGREGFTPELPFVDIQKVAMAHATIDAKGAVTRGDGSGSSSSRSRGRMPGLSAVAEHWLGRALDKEQQCSDWDSRPLSERQLRYAACDAAVLVEIAETMALQVPVSGPSHTPSELHTQQQQEQPPHDVAATVAVQVHA